MTVANIIGRMRENTQRITAPAKEAARRAEEERQAQQEERKYIITGSAYTIGFGRYHRSH